MVNKLEVLALIPARGGSKGIPRKNIRDFAGYPLIAYSIVAALQASSVTRVIVTTDDEEIAFNACSHTELIRMRYKNFEDLVKPKRMKFSELSKV